MAEEIYCGAYFYNGAYHEILVAPRPEWGVSAYDLNNLGDVMVLGDPAAILWNGGLYRTVNEFSFTPGSAVLPSSIEPLKVSNGRHLLLNGYVAGAVKAYLVVPAQDADGDGMSDDWGRVHGLSVDYAGDADQDWDGDGVSNLVEYQLRRNPLIRDGGVALALPSRSFGLALDSDQDGMPDTWEDSHWLASADPADAALDYDHDGVSNLGEFQRGTSPAADPWLAMIPVNPPSRCTWEGQPYFSGNSQVDPEGGGGGHVLKARALKMQDPDNWDVREWPSDEVVDSSNISVRAQSELEKLIE